MFFVTWSKVDGPANVAEIVDESAARNVFDALESSGFPYVAMRDGTRLLYSTMTDSPAPPFMSPREAKGCTHPEDEPCFGQRKPAPAPHPRLSVEREARRQAAAALDHHLPGSGPEYDWNADPDSILRSDT